MTNKAFRPRPQPLSEDEIDELEDRLQRSYGEITSFTTLDGFFTALHCGPDYVLPTQFFALILGSDDPNPPDHAPSVEYHAETGKLLIRHWYDLAGRLARGEFQNLPIPRDDLDLPGEWWSEGFLLVLNYMPEEWEEYFYRLEEEGLFAPMQEFAREASRTPEERCLTGERRKELHQAVIDAVNRLYQLGREARGQA